MPAKITIAAETVKGTLHPPPYRESGLGRAHTSRRCGGVDAVSNACATSRRPRRWCWRSGRGLRATGRFIRILIF
jgi:hypothetical protein